MAYYFLRFVTYYNNNKNIFLVCLKLIFFYYDVKDCEFYKTYSIFKFKFRYLKYKTLSFKNSFVSKLFNNVKLYILKYLIKNA